MYKALQGTILRLAPRLVRTGRVQTKKFVRWVELDDEVAEADRAMLAQPVALAALGRYVIRLCRDSLMKWRRKKGSVDARPVIITVHHPHSSSSGSGAAAPTSAFGAHTAGWVTVLGLPVPSREGEVPGPNFLTLFQDAAGRSGALYTMDSFDSASMIMEARSLENFMKAIDMLVEGAEEGL